jgi:hypothetical protein
MFAPQATSSPPPPDAFPDNPPFPMQSKCPPLSLTMLPSASRLQVMSSLNTTVFDSLTGSSTLRQASLSGFMASGTKPRR